MTTTEPNAIEVEVVEIDGAAPPAKFERTEDVPQRQRVDWQDWQSWQGRVRTLDSRWWPVWGFLGVIAVFLLLTVGLVVGMVFLIFRILTGLVRAISR